MKSATVSLCIPTHGRPQLLQEALESGIDQTQLPSEIVVSDDAGSEEVRELVEAFARNSAMPVRYVRCATPGQPDNINNCFREAASDLILLLHDDDLLTPIAVEELRKPFLENEAVVASFGKQIVVTNEGKELLEDSDDLNEQYCRTVGRAGLQPEALVSAILQQFPNDGYMVRTSVARAVLQRARYGTACDFDFGIRCAEAGAFYFINQFTAKYRLSVESVVRGSQSRGRDDGAYQSMHLCLELLERYPRLASQIRQKLRQYAPGGIMQAIRSGRLDEAKQWYFGPFHRGRICTPGGIRRGLLYLHARSKAGGAGTQSR